MRRPAFQFYPGDWQSNPNLRRCTHEEKGTWIDVLCLLHDQEEYGVLRWSLKEIAQATGARLAVLQALIVKGVLKGADTGKPCAAFVFTPRHAGQEGTPVTLVTAQVGPLWYSSRMVRDEYVRTKRGLGSRFGEEPKAAPMPPLGVPPKRPPERSPKPSPMPPFGDGPSSPSSSSTSKTGGDSARAAGEAVLAMRRAGMASVNPSHPDLLDLLAQGVTAQQLADLTAELFALHGPKPQAYVLTAMRNRLHSPQAPQAIPQPPRPAARARSVHDDRAATIAAFTTLAARPELDITGLAERVG